MNCSHSLNIKVKICQNGLLEECARCKQILKVGLILQRQSIILVFYQLAEELANFCGTSVLRYTTVESVVLSGTERSSCPPLAKIPTQSKFPAGFCFASILLSHFKGNLTNINVILKPTDHQP